MTDGSVTVRAENVLVQPELRRPRLFKRQRQPPMVLRVERWIAPH